MNLFKMPSDIRPSNRHLENSGVMGSRQSRKMKDTVFPPQAKKSLEYQNKSKPVKQGIQPNGSFPPRSKEYAIDGTLVHLKTAGNQHQMSATERVKKDDELVKYMSDLPCYLQRIEKDENLQEKALNVGVLDWTRLEKWNGDQKFGTASYGNKAPVSSNNLSANVTMQHSTFSDAIHRRTLARLNEQRPSTSSTPNASRNDGISQSDRSSVRHSIRFHDVGTASKSSLDGQRSASWRYKSFGQNNPEIVHEKGKRKNSTHKMALKEDNRSSNLRHSGALVRPQQNRSAFTGEYKKRVEEMQLSDIDKEDDDQKATSGMIASSSNQRSYGNARVSKEMKDIGNHETKKKTEKLQELAADPSLQHRPGEKNNIVLLLPKKVFKYHSSEAPRPPSYEKFIDANKKSLSDTVSHEDDCSEQLNSEIPHSYPLLSEAKTNMEPSKIAHSTINTQGEKVSSDASHTSAHLHRAQIAPPVHDHPEKSNIEATITNTVRTPKVMDQETAELAAHKGRHPSPNRRFSFSLGRMSRSFSFKESSDPPQLSSTYVSTKSGPVMTDVSASVDNSNREKAGTHSRARSSPLRRMLDPLLKPKSVVPPHSAETDPPLKGSLKSFSLKSIETVESYHNENHGATTIQALLKVTIKNGLPLFRFVVNNSSSSILAATPNNATTCGKNDVGSNYTFYAIDEIKKKGGSWIRQGSKEKSCGYVYNVIGQMKVSSSCLFDGTGKNSISQYMVKESVLFGVELKQADQASPRFIPKSELAAIVVKMPKESLIIEKLKSDKDDGMEEGFSFLSENMCSCRLGENEQPLSVTALLPGGVHSLPNGGIPSSLIHRWKSGGSCDCGGWDVGCKLHILSNESDCCKIPRKSKSCLTSEHLELCNQGGAQQGKPMFSLAPIEKGMYSIVFSPSISLLQAFFISVTSISCQKFSQLVEVGTLSEANVIEENSNVKYGTKKIEPIVQGKVPVRYTPNPPHSPVGRA